MANFVQIGDRAFNPDHIVSVWLEGQDWDDVPQIEITFDASALEGPQSMRFKEDEAEAFKAWWENHADVYVVPT